MGMAAVMAQSRPAAMSAVWSLSKDERTCCGPGTLTCPSNSTIRWRVASRP